MAGTCKATGVIVAFVCLSLFAATAFGQQVLESAGYAGSGFYENGLCSMSAGVSGKVMVSADISDAGVVDRQSSPVYAIPTDSSTFEAGLSREGGYSPAVRDRSSAASGVERVRYIVGTGPDNAYAVSLGPFGLDSTSTAALAPEGKGKQGHYGWYAGSADAIGYAASIGSGSFGAAGADGSAMGLVTSDGSGTLAPAGEWGLHMMLKGSSTGPAPVQFTVGCEGSTCQQTAMGVQGTGNDNTAEEPIYPVAIVFDPDGKPVDEVPADCGVPLYYRTADPLFDENYADTYNVSAQTDSWEKRRVFAGSLACTTEHWSQSVSSACDSRTGDTCDYSPTITDRNLSCLGTLPAGFTNRPGFDSGNEACSGGIAPSQNNAGNLLYYKNQGGYTIKTYVPVASVPPAPQWPPTSPGINFALNWAKPVYIQFAQACVESGQDPNPGATPPSSIWCDVSVSGDSNPVVKGVTAVTWSTALHVLDDSNNEIPVTVFSEKWVGSDGFSANTAQATKRSYSAAGQQYATATFSFIANGFSGSAICSKKIMVAQKLAVECSGIPNSNVADTSNGTAISWHAFPTGGDGDYSFDWNLSPEPDAYTGASLPVVTATYNSKGRKSGVVTVKDGTGDAASAACSSLLGSFSLGCEPDSLAVVQGGNVTWNAFTWPRSGNYSYSWTGNLPRKASGTEGSSVTVSYSGEGKFSGVAVTAIDQNSGESHTARCPTITVLPGMAGPSCTITANPDTIPEKGGSSIAMVSLFNLKGSVVSAAAQCGRQAYVAGAGDNSCVGKSSGESCTFICHGFQGSGTMGVRIIDASGKTISCQAPVELAGSAPASSCSLDTSDGDSSYSTDSNPISFSASATGTDGATPIAGGKIDFGDGSQAWKWTDFSAGLAHKYTPGNYTATLTVSDGNSTGTCNKIFTVSALDAPSCSITAQPQEQAIGLPITFTATSIDPANDNKAVASGSIDFGDGNISVLDGSPVDGLTITHGPGNNDFPRPMTYHPKLIVQGTAGSTSCETAVTILPGPAPSCTLEPEAYNFQSAGATAQFTLTLNNFIQSIDSVQLSCNGASPQLQNQPEGCTGDINSCIVSCANYQQSSGRNGVVVRVVSGGRPALPCYATVSVSAGPAPTVKPAIRSDLLDMDRNVLAGLETGKAVPEISPLFALFAAAAVIGLIGRNRKAVAARP